MKILYVCHRFPFPPKRGGKIRPFNMIRHLVASARGDGRSLARSDAGSGGRQRASRRIAPRFEMGARARSGAGAAHDRAAADADAVVDGLSSTRRRIAQRDRASCSRSERFDLIFVHCSSVAQYVADVQRHPEDPRLRRHGFAEVARVRALQAVSAVAGLPARRRGSSSAEERRLAPRFDLCTATTRAEWETLEGYGTGVADRLVPERRRQRVLRADRTSRTTPTRSRSSGAWTTTRTRNACSTSARRRCRCSGQRRPALKLLIVGADPSPAVRRLGEHCRASP